MDEFGEWQKRRDAEAVEASERERIFEAEVAEFEASEDRRMDREERMERRRAIEAEDAAMARSMNPSEVRAKAVANPKPVTKNKR